MAIAFIGTGSGGWAIDNAATTVDPTVNTLVNVDHRVFCIATWKDFSITATCADLTTSAAWTEIDESADGSVGTGNGTGSMKVAIYYFDWNGVDTGGPRVTFSTGTSLLAAACTLTFSKGATEAWATPTFTTGSQASSSTISVTGAANLNYAAGDLLIAALGIRDDGSFTNFSASATGITWASAFNVSPGTDASTTLGNDMSASAGYRIASSGTSSAAPTMSGTLAAAETGRGTFIRQALAPQSLLVPHRHRGSIVR